VEILGTLIDGLREVCSRFADKRRSQDVKYSMVDIGLSAFSLFFMQSESFLSYQRRLEAGQGSSNCQTLFGIKKIPTDNHIRTVLDEVSAEASQPSFDQMLEVLQQCAKSLNCSLLLVAA
jgi:hypothetical protein